MTVSPNSLACADGESLHFIAAPTNVLFCTASALLNSANG